MKKIVLPTLVLVALAACGKSGADRYEGYWQEKSNRYVRIVEIKKESGHYFLDNDVLRRGNNDPILLNEKDGELVFSNGRVEMPLKLSDDGKLLFAGNDSYQKIDAEVKDKWVAHEESCRKVLDDYEAENRYAGSGLSVTSQEYVAAKAAVEQKYRAQFAELEKVGKCNNVPIWAGWGGVR